MSDKQYGKGAGLSGTVDLPGASAKFECKIYRWSPRLNGATKPRRGRGGGVYRTVRWLMSSGTVALTGSIVDGGVPQPTAWKGQAGTITFKIATGKTIAYPITVTEHGFDFDAAKNDRPRIVITADVTGDPTYSAGWGTQPTSTDPSKSDQVQWPGSVKTIDPNGLQSSATRYIDIWGTLTDSDAAEQTKLLAVIAAAAVPVTTPHNFKLKTSSFERDSLDGGTITETWGLTDTKEDWINPQTTKNVDPNKMQTGGTVADINATPTIPTVSGNTLVERTTTTVEINDSKTGHVTTYGQRDTIDDEEMPGTTAKLDYAGIESNGQDTNVYLTGDGEPADANSPDITKMQVVARALQELNRDQSKKITYFDVNTSEENWLYARLRTTVDPSDIKNLTILGAVYSRDGAEPSAPGAIGLVLNHTEYFNITSPNTSNLLGILWFYAETTSADDEIFPRSKTVTDANLLISEKVTGAIFTTGSPPGDPSAPTNLVIHHKLDEPLTDPSASNQSIRLYFWALRDTKDDVEMPETYAKVDNIGIDSEGKDTAVYTTLSGEPADAGSPDASLKAVASLTQELNRLKSKKVTLFEVNDSDEKWLFAHTKIITDPSNIKNLTILGAVYERGSEPSAPGASGLVLNHKEYFDITSTDTSDLAGVLWFYAETTSADDEIFPRTKYDTDPYVLTSQAVTGAIVTTAAVLGSPTAPTTPPNLVLAHWMDAPLTDPSASNKSVRLYFWELRTSQDAIEMDESEATTDPNLLTSREKVTEVFTTASGEPAAASATVNDVKVRTTTVQEVNRIKSKRTTDFGLTNTADDVTMPGTHATHDPESLASEAQQTMLHEAGDADSPDWGDATITLPDDVEPDDKTIQQLNDGKWKTVLKWAINSSKNLWERLKKKVTSDPGHVVPNAIVPKVLPLNTAVAADDTYNPDTTNLSFHTCEVIPLSATQEVQIYTFRPLSPKDESQESYKEIVDDPGTFLIGDDKREIIDSNATTAAPAVSGQVCVWRMTQKIGRATYRHRFKFGFRSLAASLIADKTTAIIDVSNLESEAFTAEVYAVSGSPVGAGAAPYSGLLNINARYIEIANPAYRLIVYGWALVTNALKLTNDRSIAIADPLEVYTYETATITADTGTALNVLAAAQLAANQSNLEFVQAALKRLTPDKVLNILKFTGDDKRRHDYSGDGHWRPLRGKPTGGYGNPASLVKIIAPGPALIPGYQYGYAQPLECLETNITFYYRRRFALTSPASKTFLGSERTVNDAEFCDRPAYTVMFVCAEEIWSDAVSGVHLAVMDYKFHYRRLTLPDRTFISGHFSDAHLPIDKVYVQLPVLYFPFTAFYDPKVYIDFTADLIWHQVTDFSVFTS